MIALEKKYRSTNIEDSADMLALIALAGRDARSFKDVRVLDYLPSTFSRFRKIKLRHVYTILHTKHHSKRIACSLPMGILNLMVVCTMGRDYTSPSCLIPTLQYILEAFLFFFSCVVGIKMHLYPRSSQSQKK